MGIEVGDVRLFLVWSDERVQEAMLKLVQKIQDWFSQMEEITDLLIFMKNDVVINPTSLQVSKAEKLVFLYGLLIEVTDKRLWEAIKSHWNEKSVFTNWNNKW